MIGLRILALLLLMPIDVRADEVVVPLEVVDWDLPTALRIVIPISLPSSAAEAVSVSVVVAGLAKRGVITCIDGKWSAERTGPPEISFYLPAPGITQGAWHGADFVEEGPFRVRIPLTWRHFVTREDRILDPPWAVLGSAVVDAEVSVRTGLMIPECRWSAEPTASISELSLVFEMSSAEASD